MIYSLLEWYSGRPVMPESPAKPGEPMSGAGPMTVYTRHQMPSSDALCPAPVTAPPPRRSGPESERAPAWPGAASAESAAATPAAWERGKTWVRRGECPGSGVVGGEGWRRSWRRGEGCLSKARNSPVPGRKLLELATA